MVVNVVTGSFYGHCTLFASKVLQSEKKNVVPKLLMLETRRLNLDKLRRLRIPRRN